MQMEGRWKGRLKWNGSQDLQDLSIRILNVTYNDSGTYECEVLRKYEFDFFTPTSSKTRTIELKVKEIGEANRLLFSSVSPPKWSLALIC